MPLLAADQWCEIFGDAGGAQVAVRREIQLRQFDGLLTVAGRTFVMECKRSGSLSGTAMAVDQLVRYRESCHETVSVLLVVPYMGAAARAHCEQNSVAWMDLSGNARIVAPGIFYQDLGHPNRFRRPGRPESAFGPKGSRVARQLLLDPDARLRQRTLAEATGLNEGHVSRVVGKLVDTGLVERSSEGAKVVDADILLDSWSEEYRFDRHTVIPGHVAARSGVELAGSLDERLDHIGVSHAATGLPAAWLLTRHAGFRLATVYVADFPSAGMMSDLGFREEPRGANTWLVVPNDDGVFHGVCRVDGVQCAHPVQVYLDLKSHPERSQEAADELRSQLLFGGHDGK